MANKNSQVEFLFSRLTWPSPLARERACTAIAVLLLDPKYTQEITEFLIEWLDKQNLESVVITGLLVFVKAKIENSSYNLPTISQLIAHIKNHSLLSWQILNYLYPDQSNPLTGSLSYSDQVPTDFKEDPFFSRYIKSFLQPVYNFFAQELEENGITFFRRHWAYEWELLITSSGVQVTTEPLNFWNGNRGNKEYTPGFDTQLSEIYRSSYLRSLARITVLKMIKQEDALYLSSIACPIDLELWKIRPNQRPSWWPTITNVIKLKDQIDTTLGTIWGEVQELWTNKQGQFGEEWVLAQADGIVVDNKAIYNLEIFGLLQKCHGPKVPDPKEVYEWYTGKDFGENSPANQINTTQQSRIQFSGKFPGALPSNFDLRFDDWSVLAVASYKTFNFFPRWQWWRVHGRSFWFPSRSFLKSTSTFSAENNQLVVKHGSDIISKWTDWTDSFSETQVADLPTGTGQVLLIHRDKIEELMSKTNSTFCWIVCITNNSRKNSYGEYIEFRDYRTFGATGIVRP